MAKVDPIQPCPLHFPNHHNFKRKKVKKVKKEKERVKVGHTVVTKDQKNRRQV